jgi:spore coat polysaccharide biosynthesis predicted glycosyltransferase SpsG
MNALIVCHASTKVGLGHLSRSIVVAKILKKNFQANVKLIIQGDPVFHKDLINFEYEFFSSKKSIVKKLLTQHSINIVFFDLYSKMIPSNFTEALNYLRINKIKLVAIDGLIAFRSSLDLIFIPSFHNLLFKGPTSGAPIIYGWDCFLLDQSFKKKKWFPGQNVIVLTGGSDASNLGKYFLELLNKKLPKNTNLYWVIGPYASRPVLKEKKIINIKEYLSPNNISKLMQKANYAISVFGVSFFELLKTGIPTVVFPAIKSKNKLEIEIIKKSGVAIVAKNEYEATRLLIKLMSDNNRALFISKKASAKLKTSGEIRLSDAVANLFEKEKYLCH